MLSHLPDQFYFRNFTEAEVCLDDLTELEPGSYLVESRTLQPVVAHNCRDCILRKPGENPDFYVPVETPWVYELSENPSPLKMLKAKLEHHREGNSSEPYVIVFSGRTLALTRVESWTASGLAQAIRSEDRPETPAGGTGRADPLPAQPY